MKILSIGQTTYDITFFNDSFPAENTKAYTSEKIENPGGGALNMTALLHKWGEEVKFLSVIGNDVYGSMALKQLDDSGIDTSYIQKNDGDTTVSSIICNLTNQTRTIFLNYDENLHLSEYSLDFNPNLIIGDGRSPSVFKKIVTDFPNVPSMLDAGRFDQATLELAPLVTYLVCSKDFAEEYTKVKFNLSDANATNAILDQLNNDFKNIVVVTLGKEGSIIKQNGQVFLIPSIEVNAIDTTGAGDIYHGAFAYGLTKGWPLHKVMGVANTAGALSTLKKGSISSIPELNDVLTTYEANY